MKKSKLTNRLYHPRYWLVWILLGLLRLIVFLPFKWQLSIGGFFGRLLLLFPTKLKYIASTNLDLCFPEWSQEKRKHLLKQNFISLGKGIIETTMSWWLPTKRLKGLLHIQNKDIGDQCIGEGKGNILLSPHFLSLELVGRLFAMHYQYGVLYRPHKKEMIAFLHEKFRKQYYSNYISRSDVRALVNALKNNESIWYAYDIDMGEKRSEFAPFFGVQAASMTALPRLIEMTGARILPVAFYRRKDGKGYDAVFQPPLKSIPSGDIQKDVEHLNIVLEKMIRHQPEDYVWQYKRFKTRPKGEKKRY